MKRFLIATALTLVCLSTTADTDAACGGRLRGIIANRPKIIRRVIHRVLHPFKHGAEGEGVNSAGCGNAENCAPSAPQAAPQKAPKKVDDVGDNLASGQPSADYFKNLWKKPTISEPEPETQVVSTQELLPEMIYDRSRGAWLRRQDAWMVGGVSAENCSR